MTRSLIGVVAALAAVLAMAQGCGSLVAEGPASLEPPPVAPDNVDADEISQVTVPTLSRDGFVRRAEAISVRVRNLSCEGLGVGSAFAIDGSTLITNRHVVSGAGRLEVDTSDGHSFEVTAAEVGVLGDIAFVRVDGTLPVSADVHGRSSPGSPVAAVGYPEGGPFTVTRGVVVDRPDGGDYGIEGPVVRITATVRPGNSGGPLLDRTGRVAGVVYAIETHTGLGLAIPMKTVNDLLRVGGTTSVPACGAE